VEFEISNSTSVLRSFRAASKLSLALYFGHCFKNFELYSSTVQVVAALKLLLTLHFCHGFTPQQFCAASAQ
jgi:hypothetical protein